MHVPPCDRCGNHADVRYPRDDAWLCFTCATTFCREQRQAARQPAERVVLTVAPAAICRTEQHTIAHYLKN